MDMRDVSEERAPGTPVNREERAAQEAPKISRIKSLPSNVTTWEFWSSLPFSTRLFLILSVLDALLVVYYAGWQFRNLCLTQEDEKDESNGECSGELLHILLAMLVAGAFFVILVWDAILTENDFELLSTIILSVIVSGRVLFHLFSRQDIDNENPRIAGIVITIFFQVLTIIMAYLTYRKFGWRIYSKLACDLRLKDALEKKRLYFMLHRFQTLVKLDIQFLVLWMVVGVVMSLEENKKDINRDGVWNLGILASTVLGSVLSLTWVSLAHHSVKEEKLQIVFWLEWTLPLNFIFAVSALVFVYGDPERSARVAKESLLAAVVLFLVTRVAVWLYMRSLLKVANKKTGDTSWDLTLHRSTSINPDLLPLLRGAWIYKPSFDAPLKKRFFQLSQDFTTLRWAWNNYVLLYYVDEMLESEETLSITLTFSMEPDLVLKFKNPHEYQAWRRGLTLVVTMLLAPDPGFDRCNLEAKPIQQPFRHHLNYADQPTNALQKFLRTLGIAVTNRRHGNSDPMHREPSHRQIAAALQVKMSMSQETDGSGNQDTVHSTKSHQDSAPIPKPNNLKFVMNLDPKEVEQRIREERTRMNGTDTSAGSQVELVPPDSKRSDDRSQAELAANLERPSPLAMSAPAEQRYLGKEGCSQEDKAAVPPSTLCQPNKERGGLGLQMQVEIVDYDNLEFGKFLGAGAEGAVWAAWYLETPVAVKKTDSTNEVEMILSAGQHDNIVGFRGLCQKDSSTYIVLEYCPRGTLDVLVHQTRTVKWELRKVLQIMRGIARGMFHLHTKRPPILHRDLKPGNIFIGHGLVMKVGDFGMSRLIATSDEECPNEAAASGLQRQLTPGIIGTPVYTAPEILDERLQCKEFRADRILKADVYSYGITLWEVLMRERAHAGLTLYEIVGRWVTDPEEMRLPAIPIPKDEPQYNQKTIRSLGELVTQCTSIDADNRPDFKTILKRMNQLYTELESALDITTNKDNF